MAVSPHERRLYVPGSNGSPNGANGHRPRLFVPDSFIPKPPSLNGHSEEKTSGPRRLFDSLKHRYQERKIKKERKMWERHWAGPNLKPRRWGIVAVGILAMLPTVKFIGIPAYDSLVDHGVDRAAGRFEDKLKDFEDYESFTRFIRNVNELKAGFEDIQGKNFKKAFAQFLIDRGIDGSELADVIGDPEKFLRDLKKKEKKENEEDSLDGGDQTITSTTIP